jgi:hypothetical protein
MQQMLTPREVLSTGRSAVGTQPLSNMTRPYSN